MISPGCDAWTAAVVNHLWQSTVVVLAAWMLAFILRKNPARARYWIWMIASLKFLLPFSVFFVAGTFLRSTMPAPIERPRLATVVEQLAQPYSSPDSIQSSGPITRSANREILPFIVIGLWACGSLIVTVRWWRNWRILRLTVRTALPKGFAGNVPILFTRSSLEPGIFGIVKPVLLLPDGILDRLSGAQLDAIVAHELCHVRRRDNLTFALHMVVEVIFWFHPLVWWIESRLVEERERACDESVLQCGSEAHAYAEGILHVCRFCLESPPTCLAGVSGSDLRRRILRILSEDVVPQLGFGRKLILGIAGTTVVSIPLLFGMLHTAETLAQSNGIEMNSGNIEFEVATIRPSKPGAHGATYEFTPENGVRVTNATLKGIIEMAYDIRDFQISGGPSWVDSEQFNIVAKSATGASENGTTNTAANLQETRLRLQKLLETRFQLKLRRETKDVPVFVLVVRKGGPKLETSGDSGGQQSSPAGINAACGQMIGTHTTIANLAYKLSRQLSRPILDDTGLTGQYDFRLFWTPDSGSCAGVTDTANPDPAISTSDAPSIFSAVQEQLGLKLEQQRGPVDFLVINSVEKPSAN
jgi:uncharacterized protein (TIGR03435 family)